MAEGKQSGDYVIFLSVNVGLLCNQVLVSSSAQDFYFKYSEQSFFFYFFKGPE